MTVSHGRVVSKTLARKPACRKNRLVPGEYGEGRALATDPPAVWREPRRKVAELKRHVDVDGAWRRA